MAYASPYGDQAKEFSGAMNVSDYTITNMSYTATGSYPGWHLMGNPFASAMDWTQGSWTKYNIGAIPQIWEESAASYELIDNIGGDNSIIPAHNGFMVYTNVDNDNTLTIPADSRIHSDHFWYKNSSNTIRLLAYDLDKGLRQQTTIRENPEATPDFDLEYDSYFLAGFAPMFYSVYNEEAFALNTMPAITNSTIIPLDFYNNGSEYFNITLDDAPQFMDILLHDLKLDIVTNLRTDPVYEFTSYPNDDPHRFELNFNAVGIKENLSNDNISGWYFNNALTIKCKERQDYEVSITNCVGQTIYTEKVTGSNIHLINIDPPTGIYFAKIFSQDQLITIKFFVK